jgi:hypothetical protein
MKNVNQGKVLYRGTSAKCQKGNSAFLRLGNIFLQLQHFLETMKNLRAICMVAGLCLSFTCFGQEPSSSISGKPSASTIPEKDMMYRKTVWRTIDLREKQNKPLFAHNRQITKVIIEAVRRGELPIYKNDSLTSTITREQFFANMTMLNEGEALYA